MAQQFSVPPDAEARLAMLQRLHRKAGAKWRLACSDGRSWEASQHMGSLAKKHATASHSEPKLDREAS